MANKILKNTILEVVDNQLRMNEPKCTMKTFNRLVASGYTEKESKEMIAAVLLEEMYYILKDEQEFDEQLYSEKLDSLQGKCDTDAAASQDSDITQDDIPSLISQIEYNNGIFPKEIMLEIIRRKDEAIPHLIGILEKVLDDPEKYRDERNYFGNIHAAFLLSQFRATEAYPVFVDILRLPDEMPHDLFGDAICDAGGRILASICGGDIDPIKSLIENPEVDEYVRGQAVHALAILVLNNVLQRDEVLQYYKELLNESIKLNNSHVFTSVVYSCDALYPEEIYQDIMKAYEKGLVEDWVINIQDLERSLADGKDKVLATSRQDRHLQFIDDAIYELEDWACFDMNEAYGHHKPMHEVLSGSNLLNTQTVVKEFIAGRNDPCPCGSGKKFKKCCGK